MTEAEQAFIARQPKGFLNTLREIWEAILDMPLTMRQLALVKLFQWYAMFCYWQYIVLSISSSFFQTTDSNSASFREASLINGQVGGFYNSVAFVAAFAMVPFTRRFGPKIMHSFALMLAGIGMLCIPGIQSKAMLFIPMIGIGIAWASIMGNPYVMLAGSIPPERTGVYMGIFNMFIVLPMMIQIFTLPLYYNTLLKGNPENVIRLAGALMLCAAVAVLFVKIQKGNTKPPMGVAGGH